MSKFFFQFFDFFLYIDLVQDRNKVLIGLYTEGDSTFYGGICIGNSGDIAQFLNNTIPMSR